ncbi:MAG: NADH-quinone oxidoreductase subunit K [Candidatus Verstraetearchaeota archaeon]|jgi:multicomponent Na+:H+ antiporter subunit C|nr:NADH-quinone oxidoreductase subunit K [Candidatus Verstraetearchaeota archaeon]
MELTSPQAYIAFSIILLAIGVYCLVSKRNMIKTVIGIEITTIAVNTALLSLSWARVATISHITGATVEPLAEALVIISIVIGGAIAALALSLVVNAYRHYKTLDLKKLRRLRW